MSTSDQPHLSRRNFWRTWAGSWAGEVKKAHAETEFPYIYEEISYQTYGAESFPVKLLAPALFTGLTLKNAQVFATKNNYDKSEVFLDFLSRKNISAVFQAAKKPLDAPCTGVFYQPELAKLTSNHPALLLFENDHAQEALHHIPQALARLPEGSDVYIGNVKADLCRPGQTPTKKRLEMFLLAANATGK